MGRPISFFFQIAPLDFNMAPLFKQFLRQQLYKNNYFVTLLQGKRARKFCNLFKITLFLQEPVNFSLGLAVLILLALWASNCSYSVLIFRSNISGFSCSTFFSLLLSPDLVKIQYSRLTVVLKLFLFFGMPQCSYKKV